MNKNNLLKCSHCNHVFKHRQSKFKHEKVCGKENFKIHKCDECNYQTDRADSLLRHKRKCNRLKETAKCMECFKEFACNADLIRHIKTHEKNPYKCQSCGKTYTCGSL